MKIAIYSPYLDTLGGGEKYMLTIAEVLSNDNRVDILLDSHLQDLNPDQIIKEGSKRFNLNLSKVDLIKAPLGRGGNLLVRTLFLKQYDFLFYLTDGSIFYCSAQKNILHLQSPLINSNQGVWGKRKLSSWDLAICNSIFTENIIKKTWPIKTQVVYPPVDVLSIKPQNKKKYILSVGRLLGYKRPKKHQLLIDAFKKLYSDGSIPGWSLHIAGYIALNELVDLEKLKKGLKKYPIFFYPNYPYDELIKLYEQSSIYWHAAGFGEENPIDMEHFGITTVEAMAGGGVPVVVNLGGQKEIVQQNKSGFLWNHIDELLNYTVDLINDPKLMQKISKNAAARSKIFSKEKFCQNILELVNTRKEI